MPADRKSAPGRRAARSAELSAPPASAEPAELAELAEPAAEDAEEQPVPLNRAERRGHGKRGSGSEVPGRGKVTRRSSSVQGPRMWSNRRGGA